MFEIHHKFIIKKPIEMVFKGVSEPKYLDQWWSKNSEGKPDLDATYKLGFGPGYNWEARVVAYFKPKEFGLRFSSADKEWVGTIVHFQLSQANQEMTDVSFHHTGWPEDSYHYRISNFCWAMYLRILKRHLEFGEEVPYEKRLEV